MDDKHALHVDEVHMKPTMPRPQKLLIKLQSHFGNKDPVLLYLTKVTPVRLYHGLRILQLRKQSARNCNDEQ